MSETLYSKLLSLHNLFVTHLNLGSYEGQSQYSVTFKVTMSNSQSNYKK